MRLSRILAVAFVIGCGSAEEAPPAESAPAEVGDEAVVLDEPAAPEPTPEPTDVIEAEARDVEAVEPEAEPEGMRIGQDAVDPPRVRRSSRSGGSRGAPSPAPSRAPGGGSVYDIEE